MPGRSTPARADRRQPSVGPDSQEAFDELGGRLAGAGLVHALGLATHYVAEVLQATPALRQRL